MLVDDQTPDERVVQIPDEVPDGVQPSHSALADPQLKVGAADKQVLDPVHWSGFDAGQHVAGRSRVFGREGFNWHL